MGFYFTKAKDSFSPGPYYLSNLISSLFQRTLYSKHHYTLINSLPKVYIQNTPFFLHVYSLSLEYCNYTLTAFYISSD